MKYLLVLAVVLMAGLPVVAQQETPPQVPSDDTVVNVDVDTSKIVELLVAAGVPQADIDEICAAVEEACGDGSVTVGEVRKLIKVMLKKKAQYMQLSQELKEDMKASIEALKSGVKEGIDEEEARSIVALTALRCIKNGEMGLQLQNQVRNAIQTAVQERAQVISAKKKEAEATKERAEQMIRERVGELEGTTEQKEENRRIRK